MKLRNCLSTSYKDSVCNNVNKFTKIHDKRRKSEIITRVTNELTVVNIANFI